MRVEKVKYQLVRLDSCETFAKRRGISVKQLTTWNPRLFACDIWLVMIVSTTS
jgi:sulfur relay (sulfurtransferase) complex TusBCD TusD component (DsrE family)